MSQHFSFNFDIAGSAYGLFSLGGRTQTPPCDPWGASHDRGAPGFAGAGARGGFWGAPGAPHEFNSDHDGGR